jgi:hypothetical protein
MPRECEWCGETDGQPTEADRCTLCDECSECGARDDLRGTETRLCELCDDARKAGERAERKREAREAYWDARIDAWKERRYG